jgi:hypothetical protein
MTAGRARQVAQEIARREGFPARRYRGPREGVRCSLNKRRRALCRRRLEQLQTEPPSDPNLK